MIAILGAGPHGRQIAALHPHVKAMLYDDGLDGYEAVLTGAGRHPWIVGGAMPSVRRQIAERASEAARSPYQRGIVLFPGAKLGASANLGAHVHVLYNAVVSHGCTVGPFTTICSGAVLAGEVEVGEGVLIGANATVIHGGITIGDGATIGAGAVVLDDVPAGGTVAGNPARSLLVDSLAGEAHA